MQVREGRWFVHEQPANAAAWKMKEVVCLKEAEVVFDSDFGFGNPSLNVSVERASLGAKMNKRVRKSTSGNNTRVITNSRCLADELHLKYSDQQVQKTEGVKSVKKLGSVCRNIGCGQECFPWRVRCAGV